MIRFFYTDPLAAAWMAKHFGMQFYTAHDGEEFYDFPDYLHWNWDQKSGPAESDDYLCIYPDSLHLLEPQVGDAVEVHACFYGTVWRLDGGQLLWNETSLNNPPEEEGHYQNLDRCAAQDIDRIIQRNGIAFHWPESEAA